MLFRADPPHPAHGIGGYWFLPDAEGAGLSRRNILPLSKIPSQVSRLIRTMDEIMVGKYAILMFLSVCLILARLLFTGYSTAVSSGLIIAVALIASAFLSGDRRNHGKGDFANT